MERKILSGSELDYVNSMIAQDTDIAVLMHHLRRGHSTEYTFKAEPNASDDFAKYLSAELDDFFRTESLKRLSILRLGLQEKISKYVKMDFRLEPIEPLEHNKKTKLKIENRITII